MDEARREEKTWYVCDPMKNTECRKMSCIDNENRVGGPCYRTHIQAFAMLDENGKPITVAERDDYRLKLLMDYANKLYAQDMAEARITDEMVEDALTTQPHRIPAVETWLKPTDRAGGSYPPLQKTSPAPGRARRENEAGG